MSYNDEEIGMPSAPEETGELQGGTDMTLPSSSGDDNDVNNHHHNNNDDDDDPYNNMMMDMDNVPMQKPVRKMTSTSDGTSVTGASSVDDGVYSEDNIKPLDALHEDAEGETSSQESVAIESRCWVWFKRILLFFIVFGIVGFAVVMIGARIEKNKYKHAEGTSHLYQMPQVCGVQDPLTDIMGTTYDSVQEARSDGAEIAHCGECGACSSAQDMAIMTKTADSLTRDSTRCAFKIFLGRRAVEKCMEERVGFTPDCEGKLRYDNRSHCYFGFLSLLTY